MTRFQCLIRLIGALSLLFAALALSAMQQALWAQEVQAASGSNAVRLTLPAAIDMALAHNHKLELARLSVRDSEEQKRVAQSHYYPEIKNSSEVLHITELEGITLPAGALGSGTAAGLIPATTLHIDQGGSTSYRSGTGLQQPFTQMFRIHAGVKAADADLASAKIQEGDAENAIALKVHQLYYNYLIEQMSGSTAQDQLEAANVAEQENQKGVDEGRLLADAELASRADLLDKRRVVLVSKLNLDDLTLQLDDLLGLPIGTKLDLDPASHGEATELPSRNDAEQQILQKSPEVLKAKEDVEKARAGMSVAHDAYIPDITGLARYSYQSGLPFFQHNFGSFGAAVTYDLFDGGAREANLHDARIKLSMAQTQLAQVQNDVRVAISAAYDKVEQLQELVKVSHLAAETRDESYRIQSQRAQVNAELASGVASAHAAASAAKLNVLTAELNLYLAQSDIKRLLGEMPR